VQGAIGLLQSLDQLGVLNHLDYLATVSGGGYIGGFWTAWLRRNKPTKTGERIFPIADGRTTGESAEVRHLREFSRFLLPRFRVMGTESWSIVMTGLGGLLPLTSALAVLVLMWFGWVMILGCLHARSPVANRPRSSQVLPLPPGAAPGSQLFFAYRLQHPVLQQRLRQHLL
jgi:hypothetical protein